MKPKRCWIPAGVKTTNLVENWVFRTSQQLKGGGKPIRMAQFGEAVGKMPESLKVYYGTWWGSCQVSDRGGYFIKNS